jgi:hypothetical protein
MAHYRCYFIGGDDHILEPPSIIDAPSDEAATQEAQRLCDAHASCISVDVWCGERHVTKLKRAA